VTNVAPLITSLASDATFASPALPGNLIQIAAAFHDAGLADTHTAVIDWGDGTPPQPVSVLQAAGSGTVNASYAYATGGAYVITLTVTDDDSGADTETTLAVVIGAGVQDGVLQIIGTHSDDQVQINQPGNGQIGVIATFLGESPLSFPDAGITQICIWLGDGDDQAHLAGVVSTPLVVDGGAGADEITAGAAPALLLGGSGNDRLFGGHGRSILIGGTGADVLLGGTGENILIGGHTIYDGNDAALLLLLQEWNSSRGFAERVANLRNGEGEFLDGTGLKLEKEFSVFDDGDSDELRGLANLDWFLFDDDEDRVFALNGEEEQN
jgi:Ca2+-binding RTX toxin-like protein